MVRRQRLAEGLGRHLAQRGAGDVRRGPVRQRGRASRPRCSTSAPPPRAGSSTWTTPASSPADTDPADLFGSHVYDRGAMALEALRTAIGAATFADLMEEWQVRFAGQSPGAAAFYALAEEQSGRQLDAFFQDWIFDDNKPVWPGKFNLALATTPASGPVAPGAAVTYAVSVINTGKVALTGCGRDPRPHRRPGQRDRQRRPAGEHVTGRLDPHVDGAVNGPERHVDAVPPGDRLGRRAQRQHAGRHDRGHHARLDVHDVRLVAVGREQPGQPVRRPDHRRHPEGRPDAHRGHRGLGSRDRVHLRLEARRRRDRRCDGEHLPRRRRRPGHGAQRHGHRLKGRLHGRHPDQRTDRAGRPRGARQPDLDADTDGRGHGPGRSDPHGCDRQLGHGSRAGLPVARRRHPDPRRHRVGVRPDRERPRQADQRRRHRDALRLRRP